MPSYTNFAEVLLECVRNVCSDTEQTVASNIDSLVRKGCTIRVISRVLKQERLQIWWWGVSAGISPTGAQGGGAPTVLEAAEQEVGGTREPAPRPVVIRGESSLPDADFSSPLVRTTYRLPFLRKACESLAIYPTHDVTSPFQIKI